MNEKGEVDFKTEHKYAEHMDTGESQAVSDFAMQKTIKQQREFLPIYAVKEEVGRRLEGVCVVGFIYLE